jgi:pimeloyl-ACP methyl ester carboxylesterase
MAYVLIHGGSFAGSCWDPIVPLLPDPVVAIDLPGRGSRPRPLEGITIDDFVAAVVEDIESRDLRDVVLVGHSMAGITMPGVAERIPERLRHLVFVACTVPADGERSVDTLEPEIRELAEKNATNPSGGKLDDAMATALFCNDMDDEQIRYTLDRMVPEATQLVLEPLSHAGLRNPIPRTWIRTDHDIVVPPARQDMFAERIGATVVPLDAAHMAMISRPDLLVQTIVNIA